MRKVWILVANSSKADLYQAKDVNTLELKKSFEHKESHLRSHDLVSDKPGLNTSPFGAPRSAPERTPPKLKERCHFAEELCKFLKESNGSFERLYLIASPPFLGELRAYLNQGVAEHVYLEVAKDLTHAKPEEIRSYLPPVL